LDHHRVDRTADVVANQEALDLRFPGIGVDPDDANVDAVSIGHVVGAEPAFGAETRVTVAE
jgi:hypothetical protein